MLYDAATRCIMLQHVVTCGARGADHNRHDVQVAVVRRRRSRHCHVRLCAACRRVYGRCMSSGGQSQRKGYASEAGFPLTHSSRAHLRSPRASPRAVIHPRAEIVRKSCGNRAGIVRAGRTAMAFAGLPRGAHICYRSPPSSAWTHRASIRCALITCVWSLPRI